MFGDSCAIKDVKYKMKTRHSTNSKKKHWNIKKRMHMENTVLLGENLQFLIGISLRRL